MPPKDENLRNRPHPMSTKDDPYNDNPLKETRLYRNRSNPMTKRVYAAKGLKILRNYQQRYILITVNYGG